MEDVMMIRFTPADIDQFKELSGDVNPLHTDEIYARKTPFGERVVYGILVLLRAMTVLKGRTIFLKKLKVDFVRAAFPDVPYFVKVSEEGADKIVLRVFDGTINVLKADLSIEIGPLHVPGASAAGQVQTLREPRAPTLEEMGGNYSFSGQYGMSMRPGRLTEELRSLDWLGVWQLAVIVGSSYVVGMDVPGRQALFVGMDLEFHHAYPARGVLEYEGSVRRADERVGLVEFDCRYAVQGEPVASGRYKTFMRPDRRVDSEADSGAEVREIMKGRTVAVIGGSRGIGARVAESMARHGANTIVCYQKCSDDAMFLKNRYPGRITLMQGDVSSMPWCMDLARGYPALDGIVLCASPAIKPLRFDVHTVDRVSEFIERSVSLVATPLAACISALSGSGGKCIVMSSDVVNRPFVDWPHYVAAKCAIEGFIRTVRLQYPSVEYHILRPRKVLTDLINTNMGRIGAISPDLIAKKITEIFLDDTRSDHVNIIEDFEG
ncbi:MAG: Cyclic-di-GMP-binding biofilm dispersal mediator protein [Syntrophorhabdus sp. PtaB.Bin047]|jgi:NAD(P)-dependent dehydrogenase (short-subunit alcohol dehydrogenase family)|nr:MAG: Cyclic-di-GMP-binding biofilm dispersal mediator protein [Syntrophorhabdus sp. PtaB.Bin047]